MKQALLILSVLVLGPPSNAVAQDADKYSEWGSWSKAGDGSSVEFELVTKVSDVETKIKTVTTRTGATEEEITLSVTTQISMEGLDIPPSATTRKVTKPGKEVEIKQTDCPECKKVWKDHGTVKTTKDQKVTVDGKALNCTLIESEMKDCDGAKVTSSSKIWICDDVPGSIVKVTTKSEIGETKMTVTKFEMKK